MARAETSETERTHGCERHVVHATALTDDDQPAFVHALALARARAVPLTSVHAGTGEAPQPFPRAEEHERAWNARAERPPVRYATRVHECCDDVTDTLLDAVRSSAPDLVVAGSSQRGALARLFGGGSVAEALASNLPVPLLVVPASAERGLVARDTGALEIERFVIAAGDDAGTHAALEAAGWLAEELHLARVETLLVHAEDGTPAPPAGRTSPRLAIERRSAAGSVEHALADAAQGRCLVVIATRGHDGVLDALLGSHTDHVLRDARCPVLVVPC